MLQGPECDLRWIINMDQMPVFFSMHPKKTGCEVIHIPGSCTGLVQPLDVGYNKSFKTHIRAAWEEYMINNMCKNSSITSPLREEVSHWISEACWVLKGSPIINYAWLITG
jgi:hypothetical protein